MAGQKTRDPELIKRYLEDDPLEEADLSPAEREQIRQLEESYLEDPDLLDEVMLRQGLRDLDATGELAEYMSAPQVVNIDTHRRHGIWSRALHSPQYAVAASVALAVSLIVSGLLYVDNRSMRNTGLIDSPIATFDQLISVRGAQSPNELSRPAENEIRNLLVDVGFEPFDSYRARVVRLDSSERSVIYDRADLAASIYDSVAVPLPGPLLVPGEYEISLAGRMDGWAADRPSEPVTSMRFTVVAAQ